MGLLWDLIQQSQISEQHDKSASLEKRVEHLEQELTQTRQLLTVLIQRLENHLKLDIDRDGKIGGPEAS